MMMETEVGVNDRDGARVMEGDGARVMEGDGARVMEGDGARPVSTEIKHIGTYLGDFP